MHKLKINGRTLYYDIHTYPSEYGSTITKFYEKDGMKPEKKWSWNKFWFVETGKMVPNYKYAFEIFINLHSPFYAKKEIKEKIDRKFEILNREEEIQKGEII